MSTLDYLRKVQPLMQAQMMQQGALGAAQFPLWQNPYYAQQPGMVYGGQQPMGMTPGQQSLRGPDAATPMTAAPKAPSPAAQMAQQPFGQQPPNNPFTPPQKDAVQQFQSGAFPQAGQMNIFNPTAPTNPAAPNAPSTERRSLWDRVGEVFSDKAGKDGHSPLDRLSLGLDLLAAGQPSFDLNNSGWAAAGDALRNYQGAGREEQQRQEENAWNQEQRRITMEQYGQAQKDRAGQTNRFEALMNDSSLPAEFRTALAAAGPQGAAEIAANLPGYMQTQHNFDAELAFRQSEGALDRASQERIANIRDSGGGTSAAIERAFATRDAEQLAQRTSNANSVITSGLPGLQAIRRSILEAGVLANNGQPLDANTRITLGRLFNGSNSQRANLETWQAQILGPALETMRGLGPMSERELEAAINSFSNPNMTYDAALRLIDQKIAQSQRYITESDVMQRFYRDNGGLLGRVDDQGRTYQDVLASELSSAPHMQDSAGGGDDLAEIERQLAARGVAIPNDPSPSPTGRLQSRNVAPPHAPRPGYRWTNVRGQWREVRVGNYGTRANPIRE